MAIKVTFVKTQTEHRNGRDVIVSITRLRDAARRRRSFW